MISPAEGVGHDQVRETSKLADVDGEISSATNTAVPPTQLAAVTRVYRKGSLETHALRGLDLTVESGEFCLLYTSDAADDP